MDGFDMRDPREAELARLLDLHGRWARADQSGERLVATGLDFRGKALEGVGLNGAELVECSFGGARMRGADLYGAVFVRCSFAGADLSGATLAKAQVSTCDLREARLVGANLVRSSTAQSDLRGADLTGADLTASFIWRCDLRGAVLRRASFGRSAGVIECLLAGADLRGVTGALMPYPIDLGTPEEPRLIEGDEALAWLRGAGAEIDWFRIERPT